LGALLLLFTQNLLVSTEPDIANVNDHLFSLSSFWVDTPGTLFFYASFFGDPFGYITGTMDEGHALCLTGCEEANYIQVDQTHFVQVQRDIRPSVLYLRFQFFYMLPPYSANKSYRRPLSIRIFVDS
jgi:hypothetical protein